MRADTTRQLEQFTPEEIRTAEIDVMVLSAIRESIEPVGAVSLSLDLRPEVEISQATIGRKLKEFDQRGLTQRVGFRGRELTPKGEEHLKELLTALVLARRSQAFFRTLNTDDEEKLIQVLEARRALERETARLAALRVTDEDVDELTRILESQRLALAHGEPGSYQNLAFHEAITRFARNEVIAHALYLVRNQSALTLLLGVMRQQVQGVMIRDHQEIVAAMRTRDPDRAEQAMVRHMDRILSDIRLYFDRRPAG